MHPQFLFLEMTIISAEELNLGPCPLKKNTFVTVHSGLQHHATTNIDKQGSSYPSWNEKFDIQLPRTVQYIATEVKRQTLLGNVMIGMVNLPVTDFTKGYAAANHIHFLSYVLRDRYGVRKGIINLSIRVKE
ncbi:hypothetical protein RGQ29_030204 [Quercus rubra]|uniref:C2 domain-containing protein n=1 Tax=Quercus rubra TaxID=3512 RepID=A0AAN7EGX0_QUERU|nr:hypothetical protein RGQ29_030204 [Quercus rubra]